MKFIVTDEVKALGVKAMGVEISNIDNQEITEEYIAWRQTAIRALLAFYMDYDDKNDPVFEGFYRLHEKVGVPRRKNIPACENLVKLLLKKQELYTINKAVDIYNIISMRSKLALGAHDIDRFAGTVTRRLTDGSERFVPLGADEPKPVRAGEYSYIDDSNEIICHLEIRQVEKDKVTETSRNVFYIIQGNEATTVSLLEETAEELIRMTEKFCGGTGRLL
ncbi:MAG: hypothetical protein IJH44_00460 [Solobacterium sp.]|nr:hypothetical protein [Solobacterium sp.]